TRLCTPSSTLFPYTTLFRSCICKSKRAETGFHRPEIKHTIEIGRRAKNFPPQQTWQILVNRTIRVREKLSHVVSIHDVNVLILTDRKSTRLNSSHSQISYAV